MTVAQLSIPYEKGFCFSADMWPAHWLGLAAEKHNKHLSVSFKRIEQRWLKQCCKRFIRYSAATKRFNTLNIYLGSLRHFAAFLNDAHPGAGPDCFSRELIIEYIQHLNELGRGAVTRHQRLVMLRAFLETASINGWLEAPPFLIRAEDLPRMEKPAPRFIPEEVMSQIDQHLGRLPEPIRHMVQVIRETGLRVGELLLLPLECLEQDGRGGWFLRYTNWKMRKEMVNPISDELAQVIQAQQQYMRNHLKARFPYLFCTNSRGRGHGRDDEVIAYSPVARVMGRKSFVRHLQRWAEACNIRDAYGNIWKFQTHQFRHTVGSRMINSGIAPHIIQRYLGHESPEMTMRYAHIHDETLKQQLADYLSLEKVNIYGELEAVNVELSQDIDLQWLKRNVLAQALPNGSCFRASARGPCPHANACLTCCDFRTTARFLPQHKQQLEETEKLLAQAKEAGWKRQLEMNEQVRTSLVAIIGTLEGAK